MNSLEEFLKDSAIHWIEAMNLLQEEGIISDDCVGPADVAETDCVRAVEYLKKCEATGKL